jgi:uncharacterized protein YggU (UPF0235/DUF167 family)
LRGWRPSTSASVSSPAPLIAGVAGVAPSRVSVLRGHSARDKVVRVEGADPDALRAALGLGAL